MALHWDYSETDLDSTVEADRVLADAGIYATMAAGINHITKDNCLEFYRRISFHERVCGAFRIAADGTDHRFSPEDVVRLVGLSTNASTKTLAQFRKDVWDMHDRWNFPYDFKMPLDKATAGSVD